MALSLTALQKAQAEAEGFQQGPQPALNSANINTQDALGNTQVVTTSPVPYYPPSETPNLQLSTEDMSSQVANNFVILDLVSLATQASMQFINTTVPHTLAATTIKTTLYMVTIYLAAAGTGAAGHTYTETITYTAANGTGLQTIIITLPLDSANVILQTFPVLVLGGTPLTITGAYGGGAVNDPYTISERLVAMP